MAQCIDPLSCFFFSLSPQSHSLESSFPTGHLYMSLLSQALLSGDPVCVRETEQRELTKEDRSQSNTKCLTTAFKLYDFLFKITCSACMSVFVCVYTSEHVTCGSQKTAFQR